MDNVNTVYIWITCINTTTVAIIFTVTLFIIAKTGPKDFFLKCSLFTKIASAIKKKF
jgi:hypothetical protein